METAEYLCGECANEVKDEDKAVYCEGACQAWFHAQCVNVNDELYAHLSDSEEKWECPLCQKSDLPPFNSVDAVDCFHFDFQQNLPTPKLTVGQQFYCRLLWTYLFGIYSASTQLTAAYMWHELLAKRGANDVISCITHFVYCNPLGRTGAKWSIWWADNCPGQNKNNYIIWFFQDLIRRKVYTRIDYKFLVVGHTYSPSDRSFGVIEQHTSKVETVYTPQQWYEHVKQASIAVRVTEMEQTSFRNHRQHLRKLYTERSQDTDKQPLDFSRIVWFNFGKGEKVQEGKVIMVDHPKEVWVRHTYSVAEAPKRVSYLKKRGVQSGIDRKPPPLYQQYPIPLKKPKADDLRKLVSNFVPSKYQDFYAELPTDGSDSSDTDED